MSEPAQESSVGIIYWPKTFCALYITKAIVQSMEPSERDFILGGASIAVQQHCDHGDTVTTANPEPPNSH